MVLKLLKLWQFNKMIAVTYTKRQGMSVTPLTIAIDPEKIVSVKLDHSGNYAVIEYGETYDRRRQPIVYQLTTDPAGVLATITGNYDTLTEPYLTVDIIDLPSGVVTETNLQEKYIVDIREAHVTVHHVLTAVRRIEYVPGSFVPVVVYVTDTFASMVASTPTEVTTTEEATTEEVTTTTQGN
jgi:hypothetical protein